MAGWFSRQGAKFKDYGKKVVGVRDIENNHQIIRDSLARLFAWRHREVREETFANAAARLGMDETAIESARRQFVWRFYLFLGLLLIDVLFMSWSIAKGSWASLMPGVGFFALCLSQIFISSFRAYQISRRELVGLGEWWQDPDAWWPMMPKAPSSRQPPGKAVSRPKPPGRR